MDEARSRISVRMGRAGSWSLIIEPMDVRADVGSLVVLGLGPGAPELCITVEYRIGHSWSLY